MPQLKVLNGRGRNFEIVETDDEEDEDEEDIGRDDSKTTIEEDDHDFL